VQFDQARRAWEARVGEADAAADAAEARLEETQREYHALHSEARAGRRSRGPLPLVAVREPARGGWL